MSALRIILVVTVVAALAGVVGVAGWASRRRTLEPAEPAKHLRFTLTDQRGATFTDRDLAGQFALVYFGYTFCPDICPSELGFMHRVVKRMGSEGESLALVFITIDPQRDTASVLAEYVPLFNPRMIGLTGSAEAIAAAAQSVDAFYQRADVISDQPGFYLMNHSRSAYLVGRDGTIVTTYDSSQPVDQVAQDIHRHIVSVTEGP